MHSVVPMRIAKTGHIVLSVVLCMLGAALFLFPEFTGFVLNRICGSFLIVFGAIKMVGYLSKDIYRLAFQYDLVFGTILIGGGIIFLLRPDSGINAISILLGIYVFADGWIKVQVARHAREFGISAWWLIGALALLAMGGGIFVACYKAQTITELRTIMGILLILEGIMSACTVITSVKIVEYSDPEVSGEKELKRKDWDTIARSR